MSNKPTLSLQPNKTEDKPDAPASLVGTRQFVKLTNSGRMVHLFTNEEITHKPAKMDVDAWLQAQIDAGKVIVSED